MNTTSISLCAKYLSKSSQSPSSSSCTGDFALLGDVSRCLTRFAGLFSAGALAVEVAFTCSASRFFCNRFFGVVAVTAGVADIGGGLVAVGFSDRRFFAVESFPLAFFADGASADF